MMVGKRKADADGHYLRIEMFGRLADCIDCTARLSRHPSRQTRNVERVSSKRCFAHTLNNFLVRNLTANNTNSGMPPTDSIVATMEPLTKWRRSNAVPRLDMLEIDIIKAGVDAGKQLSHRLYGTTSFLDARDTTSMLRQVARLVQRF